MAGTTVGGASRRRVLRLAGGGLALAVLGAGAAGCREDAVDDAGSGGTGGDKPAGTGKPSAGGGEDGKAPKALWTESVSAETYGDNDELVAVAGLVIASGSPLSARDAATGKERWSLPDGAAPGAPLLVGDGTLYLASGRYDGTVSGYDPATGEETWQGRLGKGYRQPRPVAVDGRQVYVVAEILEEDNSSHTNVIAALDAGSGKLVWSEQRDLGTEQNGIHAAVQGRHLVYTDFKKNLTVRNTATGRQVWTQKTDKTNYGFFTVHEDLVIVPQGDRLQAFTLADGARKWSVKSTRLTVFKEPAVVDGVIHIADSGRTVRALEPATGKEIWQSEALSEAGFQVPRQYVKAGNVVYAATDLDKDGGVAALDADSGELRWTFNDGSGDHHAWLVATDGERVFALHGKKLYALPA
ncbi:PQQ-binding-like beta-propeller repeat protein [Streptomyces sp. NPDC058374]|uniref:PQQ-binding-like beta-propeller repeat protein n=1 Tax=Streptomyces sp. NPDC058374 TaxID=3346466 RepID=UPI00365D649B